MTVLIGIDPGVSGGLARYHDGNLWLSIRMPATEGDIWELIRHWSYNSDTFAMIERLGQMPRDKDTGKARQSPTTMLKMGRNYGCLRMACIGNHIPLDEVTPIVWQRAMGVIKPAGKTWTPVQKKNVHKQKAQQLFPQLKITHATADALLILEYFRRTRSTT